MKTILSLIFSTRASAASAAVLTVTNLGDNGPGSLRQAILDANANPGADTINFNLPGSGMQTIGLTNALPDITNTVVINGYSQPGSSANSLVNGDNAAILIRLDGYKFSNTSPTGLNFSGAGASGSSVRGLCLIRFYYGIKINEAPNITIAGNWVGMDVDGVARGTTFDGIYVSSFFNPMANVIIGGTAPADRNVISGNWHGIYVSGGTTIGAVVQGNFIGTDPSGTLPRGNKFGGIYLFSGPTNTIIGGPAVGAGNVLAASTAAGGTGVSVQACPNTLIQGNRIGTDVSGQYDLGNISDGVYVTGSTGTRILGNQIANNRANGLNLAGSTGSVVENNWIGTDGSASRSLGNAGAGVTISGSTNRIGGLSANQANTILFNGGAGVEVTSTTAVQNEISANSIYDNGGLAIDLSPTGINTNDLLDADTGANGLQNFPVLTNALIAFGALTVQGTLNSQPGASYRLEFFATPNWDNTNVPEGRTFLGTASVNTDANGIANFSAALATAPATNLLITATATDASGNTSEFSSGIGIGATGQAAPMLGVATNPSGGGSGSVGTTTVNWPAAAAFFTLEQTASLNPPVQWQAVTSGIVDQGGTKTFTITNGRANTNQFFRLKKP